MNWLTTIITSVHELVQERGLKGVYVFDDTCVLCRSVDHEAVRAVAEDTAAAVLAYGKYEVKKKNIYHGMALKEFGSRRIGAWK